MSSQQDRTSWNEVMLSPESENGAEGSVRQEPEEVPGFAPAAQPEGELSPEPLPDQDSESAPPPFDEAPREAEAEPPVAESPLTEETPASEAAPAEADPASSEIAAAESEESLEDQNLMESIGSTPALSPGQVVQGLVLKLTDDEVFVGLGLKSEAIVPRSEFVSEAGHLNVAVGDTVDVVVEKFDELTGTAVVSRRKALQEKLWEEIERVFYEELPVQGRVIERVKGGLSVDVGVRAFLPSSQADLKAHPNLEELIGQEITCKITKLDRERNNIVVSRRKLLEEENERTKQETLEKLAEGAVLKGRVKNLTSYGAFVDVGGLDGLLHLTDLSWTRVAQPSEVVEVGQEIEVKVLKFDKEKGRVSLGLKQLTPDP
jgi:small subunit ribosomal protein S1